MRPTPSVEPVISAVFPFAPAILNLTCSASGETKLSQAAAPVVRACQIAALRARRSSRFREPTANCDAKLGGAVPFHWLETPDLNKVRVPMDAMNVLRTTQRA